MQIIYEIADATGPVIIDALCNFGGVHATVIPLWEATVPDESWQSTIEDENNPGNFIPNPTPQPQIANPVNQQHFALNVIVKFVKEIMQARVEKQHEAAKIAAVAAYDITAEAEKQAAIAAVMAAIDTTVTPVVQ